jgi:Resolvase, N terminal domain
MTSTMTTAPTSQMMLFMGYPFLLAAQRRTGDAEYIIFNNHVRCIPRNVRSPTIAKFPILRLMVEQGAAGVALISEQQGTDGTGSFGRVMMQMATVFAELEHSMIRSRVMAGQDRVREQGKRLGRPAVGRKVENAIRRHLDGDMVCSRW